MKNIILLFLLILNFSFLSAQTKTLVKDIHSSDSSNPEYFFEYNNQVLFSATDASGIGLWISDGTTVGTIKLMSNLNIPVYEFVLFNGNAYFAINDSDLWKTDGTVAGTSFIQSFSGSGTIFPRPTSNALYFTAGQDIWKSDGTAAGTSILKAGMTGQGFVESNGIVYFAGTAVIAGSGAIQTELWKTDGTTTGTVNVADIYLGFQSSNPGGFTPYNGNIIFSAQDSDGHEIWMSDGSAAGTIQLKDIYSGSGNSQPGDFTEFNNSIYFTAYDGNTKDVWKTNGTSAGTVTTNSPGSFPYTLKVNNNKLHFTTTYSVPRVYEMDANESFTSLGNLPLGYTGEYVFINNNLYLQAGQAFGKNLYKASAANGVEFVTSLSYDGCTTVPQITVANNCIFYKGNDDPTAVDCELWKFCETTNTEPINNECDNHIGLSVYNNQGSCISTSGTSVNATPNFDIDTDCAFPISNNVWYNLETIGTFGSITINVTNFSGTGAIGVALYNTSGFCSLTNTNNSFGIIDCNFSTGNSVTLTINDCVDIINDETDRHRISVWSDNGGTFDICVYGSSGSSASPPDNDECINTNPTTLTLYDDFNSCISTTHSIDGATAQQGINTCGNWVYRDVWFEFVLTETLLNGVSVSGPNGFDVLLYDNCTNNPLSCSTGFLDFTGTMTPGTYYLRLTQPAYTCDDEINICVYKNPQPPANDDCVNAIQLTVGEIGDCPTNQVNGNTNLSTDDGVTTCDNTTPNNGIWYSFQAPSNGEVMTLKFETIFGTPRIAIFDDCNSTDFYCNISPNGNNIISGLTPNNTYTILVWSAFSFQNIDFNICLEKRLINDDCVNALPVTVGAYETCNANEVTGTTIGATDDTFSTSCSTPGNGVWYSFTAPTSERVRLETESLTANYDVTNVVVLDACNGNTIFCSSPIGPDGATIENLTANQTYYLLIFSESTIEGDFTLCIQDAPPIPSNDDCNGIISIVQGNCATGTTLGSTPDGIRDCDPVGLYNNGVWYSFQATAATVTLTLTSDNGTAHEFSLTDICSQGTLTNNIECDVAGVYPISGLTIGNTYYINIWSEAPNEGGFEVCLTNPPPANDLCSAPIAISCGMNYSGSTNFATGGHPPNGGGSFSCGSDTPNAPGVWYSFVGDGQEIILDLCSNNGLATDYDADISVFTGDCNNLVCLTGLDGDFNCGYQPTLSFTSQVGTNYLIYINGFNTDIGNFEMSVTCQTPQPPSNDLCNTAYQFGTAGPDCFFNQTTATNQNATDSGEIPAPSCGNYQGGDVWFSAIVPASGNLMIRAEFAGGIQHIGMQYYTGTCGNLVAGDCTTDILFASPQILITDLTLANQLIYIRAWEPGNDAVGDFSICVFEPTPPANDDCNNAIAFGTVTNVCFDNFIFTSTVLASNSGEMPTPSCGNYQGGDVWFSAIVPASGNLMIKTEFAGGIQNIGIKYYTGNCGSLSAGDCKTGLLFESPSILINDLALANQTIYIRVWEPDNDNFGDFAICIYEPIPPTNDDCNNAITFSPATFDCKDNTIFMSNILASDSGESPSPSCGNYQGGDVWLSAVVPASGELIIQSDFGQISEIGIQYYTGTCGALTAGDCVSGDPFGMPFIHISDPTLANQTILIRAWAANNIDYGEFAICIYEPECHFDIIINNQISSQLVQAENTITSDGQIPAAPPSINVIFKAGHSVILTPGFQASEGSNFLAYIESCSASPFTGSNGNSNSFAKSEDELVQEKYLITQNDIQLEIFPNPTQDETNLRIFLPEQDDVEISIYDFNGKLVQTIGKTSQDQGWNTIQVNTASLESGLYQVIFISKNKVLSRKMVVSR